MLKLALCTTVPLLALGCGGDDATGRVEISDNWETFGQLEKPTGKIDEPSFGGFNYLISSLPSGFTAGDMYLNLGDETVEEASIAADLGDVAALSEAAFDFSIRQVVGQRQVFALTRVASGETTTLCWGVQCPEGSIVKELLGGEPPFSEYNGLQIQLRAQEIAGSSAKLEQVELVGLLPTDESPPLLEATVTPETPSSIPIDPPGRVGQWILGTDLATSDW